MEKTAEFSLQEEAQLPKSEKEFGQGEEAVKANFDVEQSAKDLSEFSGSVSTKLGEKNRVIDEVKADGVLTEEEKDNVNKFSDLEQEVLEKGDKEEQMDSFRAQIEELKDINGDKESVRKLKKEKNGKEKELVELNLEISDLINELADKEAGLEEEMDNLAHELDMDIFGLEAVAEHEIDELKSKARANIREVGQLTRDTDTVSNFQAAKSKLREASEYFDLEKSAIKEKVQAKQDEVVNSPEVNAAREVIGVERDKRDQAVNERRQRLVSDEAATRTEYQEKVDQAKGKFGSEINELKARITNLEEQRDNLVDEVMDLETEIEDKQRLENSIKSLKAEMKKFDFSEAEAAMSDLEERAANTLSLEALEPEQEALTTSVEYALNKAEELVDTLAQSKEAAEKAINEAYEAQAEELKQQKEDEQKAEEGIHTDLVDSLNAPLAAKLEELRKAENLNEGTTAIDLIMSTEGMTKEAKKAKAKIEKSAKALDKFKANLESTFAKLSAKLTVARGEARVSLDSKVDSVSKDIDTAKTIAQEAQAGNFQAQGGWLKRTFKKLFSKN